MFLIGQYDSPFVRRTAIALRLYGLSFEHKPWSTFGDAEKVAAYNPVRRVPTLVLDDGEALIESGAILDHLDELVGPERAMIARSGPERRRHLRITALATGLADKSVSLVYERVLRKEQSSVARRRFPACSRCWSGSARRCRRRIGWAIALVTPISQWPARSASPARRIHICSMCAIRRSRPTPRAVKRCRRSRRSCSRWRRRAVRDEYWITRVRFRG